MQQITYGPVVMRAAERPINWSTLPALIVAIIDAHARIIREASAWAK